MNEDQTVKHEIFQEYSNDRIGSCSQRSSSISFESSSMTNFDVLRKEINAEVQNLNKLRKVQEILAKLEASRVTKKREEPIVQVIQRLQKTNDETSKFLKEKIKELKAPPPKEVKEQISPFLSFQSILQKMIIRRESLKKKKDLFVGQESVIDEELIQLNGVFQTINNVNQKYEGKD